MTDLAGSMGKLLAMWMDRDPQSRRSSIETYLAPDPHSPAEPMR